MPGARWDVDFFRLKSPIGLKLSLRQLGSKSNWGYFYDVAGEIGVSGAIKNRNNRLQLFASINFGESEIENRLSSENENLKDSWFAPAVGIQYYRTNIGLNGFSLTARFIHPFSSEYFKDPYFELGIGFSMGGVIKRPTR